MYIRLYQIIVRRQYHLIFESAGGKLWFGPSWGSIDLIFTCHAQFEGPRSGGPPGPYLTFKTRPTKPYIPPQPLDQPWPLRVQIKADTRGNILSPKNRCRHTLSPNRCRKTKPEPKMQHWFFHFDTNSCPFSQSYTPGQTPIGSSTYPDSIWYQDHGARTIFSGATGSNVPKFTDFQWFFLFETNSTPCSQSYTPGQTPIGSSTYPAAFWYKG